MAWSTGKKCLHKRIVLVDFFFGEVGGGKEKENT
jgi:hypothetical protein